MFSKIKSYVIIFIILATPLNSLFLSMLVSSSNSSSTILSSDYTEGTGDLSPNAETGLLWSSTSGLTGDLTTSPIIDFNTDSELVQIVYIGTEIGLSKIQVETGYINPIVSIIVMVVITALLFILGIIILERKDIGPQ